MLSITQRARASLLVKKFYTSMFTWSDAESYFGVNQRILQEELEEKMRGKPNYVARKEKLCAKIAQNEKIKAAFNNNMTTSMSMSV